VGGAERYTADLAAGLSQRGHEIAILAAFPSHDTDADPGFSRFELHRADWRDSTSRRVRNHLGDLVSRPSRRIEGILRTLAPDLVHTSNLPGISSAVWGVARALGIPVVHTLHDYYLLCPRVTLCGRGGEPCGDRHLHCAIRARRLGRWAAAVDYVVAVSDHVRSLHLEVFPGTPGRVIRLPLTPVAARPIAPPRTPPRTLAYLGALDVMKGTDQLVAAAPSIASVGVRLRIAGSGRLREMVERAAGTSFDYVGRVSGEDRIAFMESADIGILPSRWNEPGGPSYAVCEWLAAGRPVIVSARGGLRELEGRGGLLFAEPSAQGIAEGVREACRAWPTLRDGLSPAADGRDLERWLDEHESVYRDLVTRPRAVRVHGTLPVRA
jgi:glycosyltransferase involved in cell wall biosynthesis